ncbi:MAG: AIR carboxylase family protein [Candidatus Diapherotrites archaeon]
MSKALILFGSGSDSKVFEPLVQEMKSKGLEFELRILSAHKTPKELARVLKETNADIFLCGAGLSAALPGVVASETIKPVIGIPCLGAFDGMDALLSVIQMPPQIPAIGVGIEETKNAAELAEKYLNEKINSITLIKGNTEQEKMLYEKSKTFLNELGIEFEEKELNEVKEDENIHLVFKEINNLNELNNSKGTLLVTPVKNKCSYEDAKELLKNSSKHFFVGLNNYRNAVIAGIELINYSGKHDSILNELREKAKRKVLEANEEFKV